MPYRVLLSTKRHTTKYPPRTVRALASGVRFWTISRETVSALCPLFPAHAHFNSLSKRITAHQKGANNIPQLFPLHTGEENTEMTFSSLSFQMNQLPPKR